MKFEKTNVYNFEGAFRGLRNPKESWTKSDSYFGFIDYESFDESLLDVADAWVIDKHPELEWDSVWTEKGDLLRDNYAHKLVKEGLQKADNLYGIAEIVALGPKDLELAQKLIKAGPEHRKFLRQIFVSVDITAPLYFFKEFDTYKVATVANSTSTMHKLTSKPITLDCFEIDDFNSDLQYFKTNDVRMLSEIIIEQLEYLRQKYLETKDKRYWKELVRWLPESWLQTRTWTANYETLRAMCSPGQRRFHKLNQWSGVDNPDVNNFISWARSLPYASYLIFDDENKSFKIDK